MTDFKVLDPSNYNDRRSICTIDVKEDDYFSEIYGVERDKSGYGDPVLGHAINVLDVIDEEKTIIFDPIFRRMKRKDVSETKIKKYLLKEAEKEGVFAVPKNLLESWWDSGFDSRWVVVLDPTDASQTTISSYTKEEKEEHHRRRYDGNI